MNEFYEIMVPTTIFNECAEEALIDEVRRTVKVALATAFGGCTETEGRGSFLSESGELIEETVYQIKTYFNEPDDELVKELAETIKVRMTQESVMVVKNGKVEFI